MARYDDWKSEVNDELEDTFGRKRLRRMRRWGTFFVVLIVLGSVAGCGLVGAARRATVGVVSKTVNADSIIYNYQWFYDQYNAIKAQKANLAVYDPSSMEYKGMKLVLNRNIADYNSRSSQLNRNLWKASDLPYTITLE
jgi:hypothetical protein